MSKENEWLKAHICVGVKTGVITSAKITEEYVNDSTQFEPLITETSDIGFEIKEVTGDKAYNLIHNYNVAHNWAALLIFRTRKTPPH